MNKTIKTFLVLSFITATCWSYLFGEYLGTWTQGKGSYDVSSGTWSGGGGTSVSVGGERSTSTRTPTTTTASRTTTTSTTTGADLGMFTGRMFDDSSQTTTGSARFDAATGRSGSSKPTIDTSNIDFDALFKTASIDSGADADHGFFTGWMFDDSSGSSGSYYDTDKGITGGLKASDYQDFTKIIRKIGETGTAGTGSGGETGYYILPTSIHNHESNMGLATNDWGMTKEQASEALKDLYELKDSQMGEDPLGGNWCDFTPRSTDEDWTNIVKKITNKPALSAGEEIWKQQEIGIISDELARQSNLNSEEARKIVGKVTNDFLMGDPKIKQDPATGEWAYDWLESSGYPCGGISYDDLLPGIKYEMGIGPKPESPTADDIRRIESESEQFTEIINRKINEFMGEFSVGPENKPEQKLVATSVNLRFMNESVTNGKAPDVEKIINEMNLDEVKQTKKIIESTSAKYNIDDEQSYTALAMTINEKRTAGDKTYRLKDITDDDLQKNVDYIKERNSKFSNYTTEQIDLNRDGRIGVQDANLQKIIDYIKERNSKFSDYTTEQIDFNRDGIIGAQNTNLQKIIDYIKERNSRLFSDYTTEQIDLNSDGRIDAQDADLQKIIDYIEERSSKFFADYTTEQIDLNRDGRIDAQDDDLRKIIDSIIDYIKERNSKLVLDYTTKQVDLNSDGRIDAGDFAILLSCWGQDSLEIANCRKADINNNGTIDIVDFSIMMGHWTK